MNEVIETREYATHNSVIIRGDEVWLTYERPWWDVVEAIRWWLTPGKESFVFLSIRGQSSRAMVRAKRISRTHIRIG